MRDVAAERPEGQLLRVRGRAERRLAGLFYRRLELEPEAVALAPRADVANEIVLGIADPDGGGVKIRLPRSNHLRRRNVLRLRNEVVAHDIVFLDAILAYHQTLYVRRERVRNHCQKTKWNNHGTIVCTYMAEIVIGHILMEFDPVAAVYHNAALVGSRMTFFDNMDPWTFSLR